MLAYLAGGVIAFLCSGFNILSLVFPAYFLFFGVYPIVKTKLVETNFRDRDVDTKSRTTVHLDGIENNIQM